MMQRGFSNISIIHTKDNTLQDELAWLVLELKTFFVLFSRVYLAFWSKRMCRYRKRISDVARNDDIFINSRMTNCIFYLFIVLFNVVEQPQNMFYGVAATNDHYFPSLEIKSGKKKKSACYRVYPENLLPWRT